MTDEIISKINDEAKKYNFLECTILSYSKGVLTVVCSKDIYYYHNFEIRFINTFTVILNSTWEVDTKNDMLVQVKDQEELMLINEKFKVEIGNKIFKLTSSEGVGFYIVSEEIEFINEVVKYW